MRNSELKKTSPISAISGGIAVAALLVFSAQAEPVSVSGTLSTKEQIKLDFRDGTGHFFSMSRREGTMKGKGLLNDTKALDYAVHDIWPGLGGPTNGYLVLSSSDNDIAYVSWSAQANFVKADNGKVIPVNKGTWTLMSGIGKFRGFKGTGEILITFAENNDRSFLLEGDISK